MDFTFRCNITSCRVELCHRAVVTTCSHIFCEDCAKNGGLGATVHGVRVCPACETELTNHDDAVITHLAPSEDYKTSVLSGFTPTLIMECASRALAFFNYQAIHEATYQQYLAHRLTQKVSGLNNQLDSTINDANSHIQKLQEALKDSQTRCLELEEKSIEVQNAFKEKAKALSEVTKKYEMLKSEKMAAQTMNAASDEAEQVVQAMAGHHFANSGIAAGLRRPSSGSSEHHDGLGRLRSLQRFPPPNRLQSRGYTTQNVPGKSNLLFMTPSAPRSFLQASGVSNRQSSTMDVEGANGMYRQPLGNISQMSQNARPGSGTYGISAGVKMGKRPLKHATPRITQHSGPSDLPMR